MISITTLKENAPEALRLLQLALTRPRFDSEPLTRVRTQVIQSLQQDQVEPQRVAGRAFSRAFFNGHAYAHPVSGEIDTVSSITAADLRNFARTHWTKYGLKVATGRVKVRRCLGCPERQHCADQRRLRCAER